MEHEAIFEYVSVNGEMERTSETSAFERVTGPAIYEVIRVVNGNPMFLDDHLERMFSSAKLADFDFPYDADEIRDHIIRLIGSNRIVDNNIKLLAATDDGGSVLLLAYAVESFYPPEEYYVKGIKVILFNHQRDNPNAKVQHSDFRQRVKDAMNREGAFEALLVNGEGHILEGSRSNMFYVLEGRLFTAPASDVLLGITRKHIIALSLRLGYAVHERRLHRDELEAVEGLFVSGTSIGVLPVSTIDHMKLPTMENEIIKELVEGYKNLMNDLS